MKLLRRNLRLGRGEIDLLFKDANCLVCVEVKTRFFSATARRHVFDNITQRKQRQLRFLAEICFSRFGRQLGCNAIRIDAVAVLIDQSSGCTHSIEHLKAAV